MRESLHQHPRVRQQNLAAPEMLRALSERLPDIAPFRGRSVAGVVALLDWDHRIPSQSLLLRIHVAYTRESLRRLEGDLSRRTTEIRARDLYPEFDVPDYGGLPADEVYDCELRPELLHPTKLSELAVECRLVSAWRRDVPLELAVPAVEAVRRSATFAQTRLAYPERAAALGDLEAVAWTPPCESGHSNWTLDIWWLTSFDGRMGKGWSFLVDLGLPAAEQVVARREFTVRAG